MLHAIMMLVSISLFAFNGCAKIKHEISGKVQPVEVKPIQVNHYVVLDTDMLRAVYLQDCKDTLTEPYTTAELNACADEKLNSFLSDFTYSITR